jgi:hypothetical protein
VFYSISNIYSTASGTVPPLIPANPRANRYALGNLEQSPSSKTHTCTLSPSQHTHAASRRGSAIPKQVGRKKQAEAKAFDPLEELLKEKRLADKRGKGDEAFRLAEGTVAGKDALLNEMDEGWTNEAAARMAVVERARMEMISSGTMADSSGHDELTVHGKDGQRLFGNDRGQVITKILDGDRAQQLREKEKKKTFGVSLWLESSPDLDGFTSLAPALESQNIHPILQLLTSCIERKGTFPQS